jgi:DNA polymerase
MNSAIGKVMEKLEREVRECVKCELHTGRKNAVPGEGNIRTKIMFVGEAPGQEEDLQGRPFVGSAGRLFTQLLSSVGLRREDVYITNVVKCRPPSNRPPRAREMSACSEYLERQIGIIEPRVICPMGNVALKRLLGKDSSISKVHGQPNELKEGAVIFPLYHPAAALYVGGLKAVLGEDFKKLKVIVN